MDFASSNRAAKTGLGGKGSLESHLWCPNDLARLWDRLDSHYHLPIILL